MNSYNLLMRSMLVSLSLVATVHAEPLMIVAFGGSNTFGKNVAISDAYPAQLERMLRAAGYDLIVKNEGTNGQTTADELGKLDSAVPEGVRIVIFQPGGNDNRAGKKALPPIDTRENIRTILRRLLDRHILVLFSGPARRRKYVEDFQVLTIDEINQLAPDELQADHEHLTAAGYKIVAEKMLPLVKQLLDQAPLPR